MNELTELTNKFKVSSEYYIYTVDDVIADLGGILGLLLGQSFLGIYYLVAQWVGDQRKHMKIHGVRWEGVKGKGQT